MSDRGKEESVVAIDSRIAQSGSKAQIYYVLEHKPLGLSIEDIAQITGLTPTTCYIRVRELFNAQMVKETRTQQTRIYQIIPRHEIAVKGLAKSERSLSER